MPRSEFTVYARHEPTTDGVTIQYLNPEDTGNLQRRRGLSRRALPHLLHNLPLVLLQVKAHEAQSLRNIRLLSLPPHLGLIRFARKKHRRQTNKDILPRARC